MKILIVGDTHFPYASKKALNKIYLAVKAEKPTHIIQIGDLYDQYCFSRFTKKNISTSVEELRRARKSGIEFWRNIKSAAPNAKCHQILGNHDIRLTKRIGDRVPEAYEFVKEKLDELYTFKGVKTIYDERAELKIGGVIFIHGYRSHIGDHAKYYGKPVVCGHSHVGGVVFEQREKRIIWELNAGYAADENSEPLKYRPHSTCKWTLGYGLITFRGGVAQPQFIPLQKAG